MGKMLRVAVSGSLLLLFLSAPGRVWADYVDDAGIGTATLAANIFYVPAKLAYATLGGITGGFAYILTGANYRVAERVWNPSLGGDYILKQEHIRGQETIYFSAPLPRANTSIAPANNLSSSGLEPRNPS